MTYARQSNLSAPGRSLDDLPLAAYSTGALPDEIEEPVDSAYQSSGHTPERAEAPNDVPTDFRAVSANPAAATVAVPALGDTAPARRIPMPNLAGLLAGRRDLLRDRRAQVALGAVAVGLVLLAGSLLGGPGAGAGGPGASPTPAVGAAVPPAPGAATVEITGATTTTILLTGATGSGPAVGARVDASWSDALGNMLMLGGPASAGTRTTDATFVLSWTMLVEGAPVTFTSREGECTVGMAIKPKNVSGSFVCRDVPSADGKQRGNVRGTYQT